MHGDIFAFFGVTDSVPRFNPKSYLLPCFHAVDHFKSGEQVLMTFGDCLAEAFEAFGGMSTLYSLRDDPKNDRAFRSLYKKEILFLSFGDKDYGFDIYKESAAKSLLEKCSFAVERNIFSSNTEHSLNGLKICIGDE